MKKHMYQPCLIHAGNGEQQQKIACGFAIFIGWDCLPKVLSHLLPSKCEDLKLDNSTQLHYNVPLFDATA